MQVTGKESFRQATASPKTLLQVCVLEEQQSGQRGLIRSDHSRKRVEVRSEMEFELGKASKVLKWATEMGNQGLAGSEGRPI